MRKDKPISKRHLFGFFHLAKSASTIIHHLGKWIWCKPMYVWVSYDPVPNVTKPPFKSLKSCYISIKPSTCTLFVSVQRILQSSPNNEQGSPAKGKIQGPKVKIFLKVRCIYRERESCSTQFCVYYKITRWHQGSCPCCRRKFEQRKPHGKSS